MTASTTGPTTCRHSVFPSPFGPFGVAVDGEGRLVKAWFAGEDEAKADGTGMDAVGVADDLAAATLARAVAHLTAYFRGRPVDFDLPVAPHGSAFERDVWRHLQTIPYGRTTSYGAVAAAIGQPVDAARAVGAANARNPIAIVIPCHRVIGADGSLVGYAGGLERKRGLLNLESGQGALDI
ncbi:MAG: methylated-DNA--[protein]-cysteine S-methyltransferase [Ardenticatenales bacterium]